MLLAIDPGSTKSAYVIMREDDMFPVAYNKIDNQKIILEILQFCECNRENAKIAIEMIASYGMPVGREVFDTCVWIGRFFQTAIDEGIRPSFIYRQSEKLCICHSTHANDATIRQALVDRFAPKVPNKGKGTKKNPGWFYGFSHDVWAAYAVGVTYLEKGGDVYE